MVVLVIAVPPLALRGARADGVETLDQSFHQRLTGGGVVSEGVGLAGRTLDPPQGGQPGTIAITGIPGGASVARAFLYWAVLGGPDATADLAGQPVVGTEIGSSVDTWACGNSPARNYVYRRDVTALVPGNGVYPVSGVGDGVGTDGQGAALIVLYQDASASTAADIVINDGAITGGNLGDGPGGTGGNEDMSITMTPSVPVPPLSGRLHVGFGDGAGTWSELNPPAGPLEFQGAQIAAPGFLDSSDGPLWDDKTFDLPPSSLGTGPSLVEMNSGEDCILWAFTVLEIQMPKPPDDQPPLVTGHPDRPANENGWYNGPVTINWNASDPSGATQPADTLANIEGKDVSYTSGESCDSLGNCGTGSITLSIDSHAPDGTIKPQEFLFFDESPVEGVRLFDQWIEGTATDSLSGVATVRVEAENLTDGSATLVALNWFWCNYDGTSCDYGAQLPGDPGVYRVRVTAIDRAGNEDSSPAQTIVVQPPNPFGDECPLGPLCE
jgi:hypothetical protein